MASAKKHLGQYFTPEHVAEFMIGLATAKKDAKILEPSCGEGIFLKLLEEKGYRDVTGYEIDGGLHMVAKSPVYFESFVSADIRGSYDLIIGNPPYIRWKNLDSSLKEELDHSVLWQAYFNSLCDYLYIFILKSVELLRDGGELIFITPEYWINTKHAEVLRDYLVKHGVFSDIIHFNETPIFDQVSSSTIIFRYNKLSKLDTKRQKIKVTKYRSTKRLTSDDLHNIAASAASDKLEIFSRDQFAIGERWLLTSDDTRARLIDFEDKCTSSTDLTLFGEKRKYISLGDIADIGNGMVSGLDKAFQIPKGVSLNPAEAKATIPVVKAKNMRRYTHDEVTNYIFLNSPEVSENILISEYPNFYSLLKDHRDQLQQRYDYSRKLYYWQWAFPRSQNLFAQEKERIFVPCKERISHKQYFRFSYVPSGMYPTQDVTAIFPKTGVRESIYYILALLNSSHVFEWLKHKGVIKGNIVEFSEKPLASIPMRLIDWNNPAEVRLHNDIVSLCRSYIVTDSQSDLHDLEHKVAALF